MYHTYGYIVARQRRKVKPLLRDVMTWKEEKRMINGKKLRALREARGMTQEQLASAVDVARPIIMRAETLPAQNSHFLHHTGQQIRYNESGSGGGNGPAARF